MKLLLASNSQFLIDSGYELLGIPKDQLKIAYITTAAKGARDKNYIETHKRLMINKGYHFEEFDIEDKSEEEIYYFLNDKNVIHIEGGNTFYLLKAIKVSSFDKIIFELLNKGKIYVGTSAGSSIAGPTIEMSSHVPEGTKKEDLDALNFVPFLVKAHYSENKIDEYKKMMRKLSCPVKFLRDGQAFLINNNSIKLVGYGEEVKI